MDVIDKSGGTMEPKKGMSSSKLNRKLSKYSNILWKSHSMRPSQCPTKTLMVCNVGIALGISASDIIDFFSVHGMIHSAAIIPNKSYSFISFCNAQDAENCYNIVNGTIAMDCVSSPVYLLFVDFIPEIEKNFSDNINKSLPGLFLIENFLSESEEDAFVCCALSEFLKQTTFLKQRKVCHFGYAFIYGKNNIDKEHPLSNGVPAICDIIPSRVKENGYSFDMVPDQLTINHYVPGQGIPPHIDTHSAFEDPIFILSLGSDCVMDFRKNNEHVPVLLPNRSLIILSGEARYAWSHGITSRKRDVIFVRSKGLISKERNIRVSFTFRKILHGECHCEYADYCDTQIAECFQQKNPVNLENKFVHQVYENISDHFSQTRYKPWPKVREFVQSFPVGDIILDVGCGNGKYFGGSKSLFEIGCDYSQGLTEICKQRGIEVLRSDCLYLPFRNDFADGIISIAVLHHLSTEERRAKAIEEIIRVLKPSGKALIYVWAKEQRLNDTPSTYLKTGKIDMDPCSGTDLKNTNTALINDNDVGLTSDINFPIHINRTEFNEPNQDILVPWKLNMPKSSDTFLRYYHVFKQNELDALCKTMNCDLIESYYDNGNWCVILQKTQCNDVL